MNFRKISSVVFSLVLIIVIISGCGATTNSTSTNTSSKPSESAASSAKPAGKEFKVGMVSDTGGVNDHTINQLTYEGVKKAEAALGVKTGLIQSKSAADYEPNITRFAQEGYNLVIAVGFSMNEAVKKVSKQYPDTKFVILDDAISDIPNVASVIFKTEESGFLVGALTGILKKDKSIPGLNDKNVVGVVGGLAIPPVDAFIAGFQQGIKKTNPNVSVKIKYAGKFDDAALGSQITQQLISEGADVVFPVAGGTGNGVINAAKSSKIYAIGVDADQGYLAPETIITSALKQADQATADLIKQAYEGKFKSGVNTFDLKNNGVGFANSNKSVPKEAMDQVTKLIEEIKSGQIQISPVVQK